MSCNDIAGGADARPVPSQNHRDEEILPGGYRYIRELSHPDVPVLQDAHGCDCIACEDDCPCRISDRREPGVELGGFPVLECGPACSCSLPTCQNRASQRGLSTDVKVMKTEKGWSAFAAEPIAAGRFVCQYAGELLSSAETRQRLSEYDTKADGPGHALLVVREVLPSLSSAIRINVDATRLGNVARFMNHRCCGGNLEPVVVRMNGKLVPHIAMVAVREIAQGEELTFEYGRPNAGGSRLGSARRCLCGSPACLGYLPCDPVQ